MSTRKEQFRIDLSGDYILYFKELKSINNIQKNVDVFRYALETAFASENNNSGFILSNEYQKRIENLIKRTDIKKKYQLYSFDEFMKKAVDSFFSELLDFTSKSSILNWDIRSSLTGDEKQVAIAFRECYINNPSKEVYFDILLKTLSWRNEDKLITILENFEDKNLIKSEIIGNEKIYTA